MNEVSTPPNRASFLWKDSFSFLAWALLHLVYIERCFSLLQWIKYFYRCKHGSSKDPASKRPNVPSSVVEYYFSVVLLILLTITFTHKGVTYPIVERILAWYFIIDTSFWVLYYFFFRRFFEEKYAIMHTLEYIVLFPIVLLIQACGLHIISPSQGMSHYLTMLVNPNNGTPVLILLLAVIYVAVIFGLIITNIPVEKIKEKGENYYHVLVLGYGDVVKNRLRPTLRSYANKHDQKEYFNVAYYALTDTIPVISTNKEDKYYESLFPLVYEDERIMDAFRKDVLRSNILWIATPPFAHIQYLERYRYEGKFIALEKPLTVFRNEFNLIKALRQTDWDRIFCLNYYLLEKALPLTFLYRPFSFYERFLDFHGEKRESIMQRFSTLGNLKSVNIEIIDMEDDREWAFDPAYGGQMLETFIHPLSITRLVLGIIPEVSTGVLKNTTTSISYKGRANQCDYHLLVEKNTDSQKQLAKLEFDNGVIVVDMQRRELTISLGRIGSSMIISVKGDYLGDDNKYSVQWEMVKLCCDQGIKASDIDCSDIQIECLEWLFKNS